MYDLWQGMIKIVSNRGDGRRENDNTEPSSNNEFPFLRYLTWPSPPPPFPTGHWNDWLISWLRLSFPRACSIMWHDWWGFERVKREKVSLLSSSCLIRDSLINPLPLSPSFTLFPNVYTGLCITNRGNPINSNNCNRSRNMLERKERESQESYE